MLFGVGNVRRIIYSYRDPHSSSIESQTHETGWPGGYLILDFMDLFTHGTTLYHNSQYDIGIEIGNVNKVAQALPHTCI
jgi:hypothetical protein